MNSLWLVLINKKAGKVHSVHKDKATAEQWARCKEHDGDDTGIMELGEDEIAQIHDYYHNAESVSK